MASKRSEGQKRYDKFIEAYREAYPELKRITQFEQANEEWPKLKNDQNLRLQRLAELKAKAQTCKARGMNTFITLFAKQKVKNTVDNQPSTSALQIPASQSQENDDEVEEIDKNEKKDIDSSSSELFLLIASYLGRIWGEKILFTIFCQLLVNFLRVNNSMCF